MRRTIPTSWGMTPGSAWRTVKWCPLAPACAAQNAVRARVPHRAGRGELRAGYCHCCAGDERRRGVLRDCRSADPAVHLGLSPRRPRRASTPQFLDNEYGVLDVNRFATLAAATGHVAWLDEATHDDRMSSPRYRHHAPARAGRRAARRPGGRPQTAGATCACIARTTGSASPPPRPRPVARLGPPHRARAAAGLLLIPPRDRDAGSGRRPACRRPQRRRRHP